jgi:thioredoxin
MMKLFGSKKEQDEIDPSDWPSHVEILHKDSFEAFVSKYPLSVVDFWAPWYGPCKTMFPRLRRLEKLYQGKVAFARVNTQQEQALAKQFNIMSIPCFVIFRYGKKIGEARGVKSVGDMKDIIENHLSKYNK